jgi:Helix-turn-helix domain
MNKPFVKHATRDRRADHRPLARGPLNDYSAEDLEAWSEIERWASVEEPSRQPSKGPTPPKKLLTIDELREIYGLNEWTIKKLCYKRQIPHFKIVREFLFDPAAIDAWLMEHARPVREVDLP